MLDTGLRPRTAQCPTGTSQGGGETPQLEDCLKISLSITLKCKYIIHKMNCWKNTPMFVKLVIALVLIHVVMGSRREGHINRISNPAKKAIDNMNKKIYTDISTKYATKEDLGNVNEKIYSNVLSNRERIEKLERRL